MADRPLSLWHDTLPDGDDLTLSWIASKLAASDKHATSLIILLRGRFGTREIGVFSVIKS
jgi:hypothetical protein